VLSQPTLTTSVPGCHDLTAFLAFDIMAAMCDDEGQFWDISDPANPDTMNPVHFDDPGVNYWHSASFTWDGQYVVTNDESFTGTCQANGDGKIRIWRVSDAQLMSSFMIPRPQGGTYCSVHNGNIIPVAGRYILVAAWYGGGTSVVDFTNPTQPTEIAYFKATGGRGPADTWSSYWYNGSIYANDITRGLDVFNIVLPSTPYGGTWTHLNAQTQEDMYPPGVAAAMPLARLTHGALTGLRPARGT
jgi:WD40 repeat protein